MRALLDVLRIVLDMYVWVILIHVVLSWLVHFQVVNPNNMLIATIRRLADSLIDPILRRLRYVLPTPGGLDLAPLALVLLLILIQRIIAYYIYPYVP